MKIAIIGNGFTGATLPLAHHLSLAGHSVDCYYIAKVGSRCIESLDFDMPVRLGVAEDVVTLRNEIYNYLDKRVNISMVGVMKRKLRLEKLLVGKVNPMINFFVVKSFAAKLISRDYDFINVIVHTELELQICRALKKAGVRFCITFHEVLRSHSARPELKREVVEALELNVPIVIHSEKTRNDILKLSNSSVKDMIHLIHFGQFESYLSYGMGQDVNQGEGYLLYLGYIFPHKGLPYLYDAIQRLGRNDVKIVVAGNGKDPILNAMREDSRFAVINRFIENAELVSLIRNSRAIVCPYVSGSQSGLVQTAMVFNKPVVATRVAAFAEIIRDGENGYLANPADAQSLADALQRCCDLGMEVCQNRSTSESLDWDVITSEYINLASE